jgi:hypothetical protein
MMTAATTISIMGRIPGGNPAVVFIVGIFAYVVGVDVKDFDRSPPGRRPSGAVSG